MYSNSEFEQMKSEIEIIKKVRSQRICFGILNEDKSINVDQNKELVELAKPFPCTFIELFF